MRLTALQTSLWLVFSLLLMVAGLRLLSACDFGPRLFNFGLEYCPRPVTLAALKELRDARSVLQSQIHDNELKIAETPHCAPPPTDVPSPDPTQQSLRIPKQLKDLKGCWVSDRGDLEIVNVVTKKHMGNARFCYCFGEDGYGTLKYKKTSGLTCQGRIRAELKSDELQIDQPRIYCRDGGYVAGKLICKADETGAASCAFVSPVDNYEPSESAGYHRADEGPCD